MPLMSSGHLRLVAAALCAGFLAAPALVLASEPEPGQPEHIALWPEGKVPGETLGTSPSRIVERSHDPALPDRYIEQVSAPYLVAYRPARPNGVGLLVIPGGGYQRVVLDKEGTALVPAFVEQGGVSLFVLRYRLPAPDRTNREAALADAQRAVRQIRAHADGWGLAPEKIGVMGFSAGGHVAARLAIDYDRPVYPAADAVDDYSARPDFQLLIYPVIDMAGADTHTGSRQKLLGDASTAELRQRYSMQHYVHARVPPAFLLHAGDDVAVPVGNSLLFYQALTRAGVATELHLYPQGGHGFGIRETAGLPVAAWPQLALRWINTLTKEPAHD